MAGQKSVWEGFPGVSQALRVSASIILVRRLRPAKLDPNATTLEPRDEVALVPATEISLTFRRSRLLISPIPHVHRKLIYALTIHEIGCVSTKSSFVVALLGVLGEAVCMFLQAYPTQVWPLSTTLRVPLARVQNFCNIWITASTLWRQEVDAPDFISGLPGHLLNPNRRQS